MLELFKKLGNENRDKSQYGLIVGLFATFL